MDSFVFLALGLVPLLVSATPVQTALPQRRNHAGPPADYSTALQQLAAPSTTSSSTAASATSSSSQQSIFGEGVPTELLDWVAIVIAAGVISTLLAARFFFIKRYGPPTLRAYFIQPGGLHIPFLRIHIKGPPPRPDIRAEFHQQSGALTRRRRRDRTTHGPEIGEGGRRAGGRDADDGVDGDEEMEMGESLPGYEVDLTLPGYAKDERAERAERRSRRVTVPTYEEEDVGGASPVVAEPEPHDEVLPSVQAYEEASRTARAAQQHRDIVQSEAARAEQPSRASIASAATKVNPDSDEGAEGSKKVKDEEREVDIGEESITREGKEEPLATEDAGGKERQL
ncbi:hypothetical protein P7C70_g5644, partial [Phenoliferia sp. Uapishka_3]